MLRFPAVTRGINSFLTSTGSPAGQDGPVAQSQDEDVSRC